MKFIDLFSGIGGMRLAFENEGATCVFSSEIDKFAQQTYKANFGEKPVGDVTLINANNIPDHDILLAGFPCQPFSLAGVSRNNYLKKEHGFLDKTRGTLFFEIARIIKYKQPKILLLENVKNLKYHDKGKTFKIILDTLTNLGYNNSYAILNSKHFVPQNRERIFIVSLHKQIFNDTYFTFPTLPNTTYKIKDILEPVVNPKYTLSEHFWDYLQEYKKKHQAKGNGFGYGLVDVNGISRTLLQRYYKDGSEILIPQNNLPPRRLTPRECARLQGFPDTFQIPVSDTQAYRQFGNSVTVPLVQYLAKFILQKEIKNA